MHRACHGFLLVALQIMSLEFSHHVSANHSIMYGVFSGLVTVVGGIHSVDIDVWGSVE